MTLTQEQKEAIDRGQAVRVVIDGNRYVLIAEDAYVRSAHLIDDALDPEQCYPAVLEAWDSLASPLDAHDYR
jgi:hypothetical protein